MKLFYPADVLPLKAKELYFYVKSLGFKVSRIKLAGKCTQLSDKGIEEHDGYRFYFWKDKKNKNPITFFPQENNPAQLEVIYSFIPDAELEWQSIYRLGARYNWCEAFDRALLIKQVFHLDQGIDLICYRFFMKNISLKTFKFSFLWEV